MSSAQFYYYKNRGQTLGPFDLGQIQQRAKRAQISNRSEISTDGFSWQPAQNFPEIFAGSTAAPPSAAISAAAPAVAVVEEAAEWYYMLNGEQQGPVTEGQLQQMIGLGNVKDTDHVWKDGMIDWLEIRNVPDLAVQQANAPQAMMQQQPMQQQPMMQQPIVQQNTAQLANSAFCTSCGQAIAKEAPMCPHCGVPNKSHGGGSGTPALVLGIISLIAWIIPIIGLPVSISGIVVSCRRMKVSMGMAITGLVLSILGLILSLVNAWVGAIMFMN